MGSILYLHQKSCYLQGMGSPTISLKSLLPDLMAQCPRMDLAMPILDDPTIPEDFSRLILRPYIERAINSSTLANGIELCNYHLKTTTLRCSCGQRKSPPANLCTDHPLRLPSTMIPSYAIDRWLLDNSGAEHNAPPCAEHVGLEDGDQQPFCRS